MTRWQVRLALVGAFVLGAVGSIVGLQVRQPGASGLAHAEKGPACATARLTGSYGGLQTAEVIAWPPGFPQAPLPVHGSSVNLYTFDGAGKVARAANTFNVGGMVGSDLGMGTYTMNADCTFAIAFPPANGFPEDDYVGVLVAGGKRAYAIGTSNWILNPIVLERQ